MATPANDSYSAQSGGAIYGGRWGTGWPVGQWQRLTVAAHLRKIGMPAGSVSATFDPSPAEYVDALTPQSINHIPVRSYSSARMGEPGVLYYTGGLHNDYPGNEIDRIDLRNLTSTTITTTLNHQPVIPPAGPDSGYGWGSSGYVYRQYGTPFAAGDRDDWMPYSHHTWCKNTWHPTWGVCLQTTGALDDGQTVGANPAGSGTQYPQKTTTHVLIGYNWTEGKYHVRVPTTTLATGYPGTPGPAGASDWSQARQSLLMLNVSSNMLYVSEVMGHDATATPINRMAINQGAITGSEWSGLGGVNVKWLESNKFLGLRIDNLKPSGAPDSVNAFHSLFLGNLTPGSPTPFLILTPPAGALAGCVPNPYLNYTFCVDRNSRRIFWMVFKGDPTPGASQFFRFYVSTFDAIETWTEISTTGFPTDLTIPGEWFAGEHDPLSFYDGHLFLSLPAVSGGSYNLHRIKVDNGEPLPVRTFNRYDYWAQNPATRGFIFAGENLGLLDSKHVNYAYHHGTGAYYHFGGDCGGNTTQYMAKIQFDATPDGYTITDVMDQTTNAVSGKYRPASPDDGAWNEIPTDSAWVAGRGKLLWQRGGDGMGMFLNDALRTKYGVTDYYNPTPEQTAAAIADGWDRDSDLYLFDPAAPDGFSVFRYNDFTQDNGGRDYPPLHTWGTAASRNGTFDPVTGCVWKFYANSSHHQVLACIDMVNQTIKMFNVETWVSPDTGRTIYMDNADPASESDLVADGSREKFCFYVAAFNRWYTWASFSAEHKAIWLDAATGYLYVVSPCSGYLWRFDTRGTHTNTAGNGWKLPMSVIGKPIPLVGIWPGRDSWSLYPPPIATSYPQMVSFLYPFKGGLLWWSSGHNSGAVTGVPKYAFWRRLGYTGDWSVVTMPVEFAANAAAAKEAYSIDNQEILGISQTDTASGENAAYRYFWRIT